MSISNTKKAIAGVTLTLGLLIGGGFSYHEYKVISDENEKLSGKIHSQGNVIFEQNNQLMKNEQYIEELKAKNDQLESDKKKVNDKLSNKNKEVKKLKKKIDSIEKEVSPTVSSNGKENKTIKVKATAYTAYCDTGCIGITKTGKDVSNTVYENGNRVIAVDPSVIPLYSKLKIETDNETFYAVALDTGGAIKQKRIDVLMENNSKAVAFGVQEAKVTILK